jgi:D-beta-D-heptose 7-phosphate kinase/D-beta-D-heptose 1-phosphate adenosyltransferase
MVKPLLIIGDALLDRDLEGRVERSCPDAPAPVLDEQRTLSRPGGAALAAVLAAGDGREVTLISALGEDAAGCELEVLLAARQVELLDLGLAAATPEKVRVRNRGRTLLRIDRGEAKPPIGPLTAAARAAIGWAETILVSDYGRGLSDQPALRDSLGVAARGRRVVWDPHPRGAAPVRGVTFATPNRAEARIFAEAIASRQAGAAERVGSGMPSEVWGRRLAGHWDARHVCVTCGGAGAVLCAAEHAVPIEAPEVCAGDACGAGDRFAAGVSCALADGASPLEAARVGVARASDFVACGGASGWAARNAGNGPSAERLHVAGGPLEDTVTACGLASAVHAHGGTLVATGGCFDLLHAGHLSTLQAARELGDRLIVCLNSDVSVSRLKGPMRPLVGEADRARLLQALACVDAVAIFDEDTPLTLLGQLRPDVWVKGGDYEVREMPERSAIEESGGRVVTLPYVHGHSTSGLLKEVVCRGI